MHDETQDPKPHVHIPDGPHGAHEAAVGSPGDKAGRKEISIWFFCGILSLGYGLVLTAQGLYEYLGHHEPPTILANLQPTLWWGIAMTLFGSFYTIRFRPGKG